MHRRKHGRLLARVVRHLTCVVRSSCNRCSRNHRRTRMANSRIQIRDMRSRGDCVKLRRGRRTKHCSQRACSHRSASRSLALAFRARLSRNRPQDTLRLAKRAMSTTRKRLLQQERCTCRSRSGRSSSRSNLVVQCLPHCSQPRANLRAHIQHRICPNEKRWVGSCSIDRGADECSPTAELIRRGTAPRGSRPKEDSPS